MNTKSKLFIRVSEKLDRITDFRARAKDYIFEIMYMTVTMYIHTHNVNKHINSHVCTQKLDILSK